MKAAEIGKEANYAGVRVTMIGLLDGARCPVQIDIGFGDAVTPAPENVQYPVILDGMPQPQLRVYPRYTVVAEKLEAMVKLGILNSRLKDYFDLWVLARHSDFGAVLAQAIRATSRAPGHGNPARRAAGPHRRVRAGRAEDQAVAGVSAQEHLGADAADHGDRGVARIPAAGAGGARGGQRLRPAVAGRRGLECDLTSGQRARSIRVWGSNRRPFIAHGSEQMRGDIRFFLRYATSAESRLQIARCCEMAGCLYGGTTPPFSAQPLSVGRFRL